MSKQLIDLSYDLKKLRDEGYNLEIRANYLLVKDIPYVNSKLEIKYGILVSELTLAGEKTDVPNDHVVEFIGETPCDLTGSPLTKIIIDNNNRNLCNELTVQCKFSSKPVPSGKYKDYYDKMTAYANILTSFAQSIDPDVKPQTFPVLTSDNDESVFNYLDTASSRAGISLITKKLELTKIAIVGLGGTGSYVLDLVAKTPIKEIHLFDSDTFLNHNAFRSPGAASIQELSSKPKKVVYLKSLYSRMHRGIVVHDYNIDASNVSEINEMKFVFLCMEGNDSKKTIVENLESFDIPFVDVGLDVGIIDDSLNGIVRVTTNSKSKRDHFRNRVSLADPKTINEYDKNIQIADLNSLNATLAVIKWKKLFGFYLDFQNEYHSTYSIDCNSLTNDEQL